MHTIQYAHYLGQSVTFFYQPMPNDGFFSEFWVKVSGKVEFITIGQNSFEFFVNGEFYDFFEVIFV